MILPPRGGSPRTPSSAGTCLQPGKRASKGLDCGQVSEAAGLSIKDWDLRSVWDQPLTSQVTLDKLHPSLGPCFLTCKVRG